MKPPDTDVLQTTRRRGLLQNVDRLWRSHVLADLCNGEDMKTHLNCPCGEAITGEDEDDLVEKAQAHLSEAHPGREYDRDAILFMAY